MRGRHGSRVPSAAGTTGCGSLVPVGAIECAACGAAMTPDERWCRACGEKPAPVTVAPPPVPVPEPESAPPPSVRRRGLLVAGAAAAAAVAAAVVVLGGGPSDPSDPPAPPSTTAPVEAAGAALPPTVELAGRVDLSWEVDRATVDANGRATCASIADGYEVRIEDGDEAAVAEAALADPEAGQDTLDDAAHTMTCRYRWSVEVPNRASYRFALVSSADGVVDVVARNRADVVASGPPRLSAAYACTGGDCAHR